MMMHSQRTKLSSLVTIFIAPPVLLLLLLVFYDDVMLAQSASISVPQIRQPGYRLTPKTNGYVLRLSLPNGNRLLEKAEYDDGADNGSAPTFRRFGKIRQQFPETNGVLTIFYIADERGYRARVNFTTVKTEKEKDDEVIEFDSRLDATSLKTLGG